MLNYFRRRVWRMFINNALLKLLGMTLLRLTAQ